MKVNQLFFCNYIPSYFVQCHGHTSNVEKMYACSTTTLVKKGKRKNHHKLPFRRSQFFYKVLQLLEISPKTRWTVLRRINPLSVNLTKWSNTLKQFTGNLPTNYLNVSDHYAGLALKGLKLLFLVKSSENLF